MANFGKSEPLQTFNRESYLRDAPLSRDEMHLPSQTERWLHQAELGTGRKTWSRRLSGCILNEPKRDDAASTINVLQDWPGGGLASFKRLRLDGYDEPPMQGEPGQLLKDWQDKLGLQINDAGDVVPLRPLPVTRRRQEPL